MQMLGIGRGSSDFAQLVRDAQKFYVGDVCTIEGIAQPQDFPRLPYPLCVFEFQDIDPKGISRPFFLLCEEIGYSDPSYNSVRVHSFIPYPTPAYMDDLWLHSGCVEVNRETDTYDSFINKNTLQFLDAGDGFSRLADANTIEESIISSAQWLCRFLAVLNCSNVEITEVGDPKFINKKRKNKGKVPIYSYKTLVLKTRQQRLATGSGTHESPRIHLRRGHVKRRKTGDFWWQPCVVGDRKKGVVVKDYRADCLAA
jgi:hypothetical protein